MKKQISAIKEAMSIGYSTEITLEQYQLLESLLPSQAQTGRPRTVNLMLVIQGLLFVLGSGCAWRLMPKEYPPSSTVYYCLVALFTAGHPPSARRYFRKWRDDGSWKQIHARLVQWVRVMEGRESNPSVGSRIHKPCLPQ